MCGFFRSVGNVPQFLDLFKQRLIDCYTQQWHSKLMSSSHFECYRSFKSTIMLESFLHDRSWNRRLRNVLLKFRLGVSDIKCHRYKFYNYNNEMLICPVCLEAKEDEYHVMFICKTYETLRHAFIPEHFLHNRNICKMYILLANSNVYYITEKYIYHVFKLRKNLVRQ